MVMANSDTPRPPRSSSFVAVAITKLTALCTAAPYALVAVGLRVIIARLFFIAGQGKIVGPAIPVSQFDRSGDFTIVLPAELKPSTFELFQTQYAALPLPPTVAAYLFAYAEFVLPICLVVGFATRLSALGLLIMVVLMEAYVTSDAFWTLNVYVIAILLVLMSVGPGAISLDTLIRYVYRK